MSAHEMALAHEMTLGEAPAAIELLRAIHGNDQRVTVIVHPPAPEAPQLPPTPELLDVTISMETASRLLDYDDSALDELTIAVDGARQAAAAQFEKAMAAAGGAVPVDRPPAE